MSTKATIVYGDEFHFYHEVGDQRHVYLEMRGTHYEAGYNCVMIPIPIHIWEVIRTEGGVDLSLVDKTDSELEVLARERVDQRIADYERHKESPLMRVIYFDADQPREEQIARTLKELHAWRREQQEIRAAINEIRAKNRNLLNRGQNKAE